MKKVIFIIFLLFVSTLTLASISSASNESDEKVVGVILIPNIPYFEEIHQSFIETISGESNLKILTLNPLPEPISLMNTTRKFAAVNVDIIVTYGAPATIAAVKEQSEIPVVFAGVFAPKALGISLKNATGISSNVPVASILKTMKSIKNFSRLGVIYSNTEQDTVYQAEEIEKLEGKLNFKSIKFNIRNIKDTGSITDDIEALILTTSCPATYCINNIVNIARSKKVPTASLMGGVHNSGILITMSANPVEQGKITAAAVKKILDGSAASSLPVNKPREIDFIINLREASSIGVQIPFDLLSSSTRIIR